MHCNIPKLCVKTLEKERIDINPVVLMMVNGKWTAFIADTSAGNSLQIPNDFHTYCSGMLYHNSDKLK